MEILLLYYECFTAEKQQRRSFVYIFKTQGVYKTALDIAPSAAIAAAAILLL